MKIKIGVVSLGCPKNLVDTEYILGILHDGGYEITPDGSKADVIIINTCGFIDEAKEESIQTILEMAQYKQKGACKALVVTGCLSQRYGRELYKKIPEIDGIAGVNEVSQIKRIIERALSGEKPFITGSKPCTAFAGIPRMLTTPGYSAYLRIADGCDNRCSYCAIPDIRGGNRSRMMEDILSEARTLAEKGVKELIIVAQDTTRYGGDIYGKPMLAELIGALSAIEGIHWLRVMYLYPERVSEALLNAMMENPKVCRYADIPIQHADGRILRAMNRRGDEISLGALIETIRRLDEAFIIRTTVMAGFPGETQEAFEKLKGFIRSHPFDRLGAFAYSPQEGTPAARLKDDVPAGLKRERLQEIMELQRGISQERNSCRVGKRYEVLTDGFDEAAGMYFGRSYGESPGIDGLVYFTAGRPVETGSFVNVLIKHAKDYDISGELAK
ncbi:MAG: 30S ribosomal protein S12 methylthiotransferase RimO [Bacillota bacterium]|nr:30S ribosomal protein S12 methylthiotransferase RimO [Bacillota bacterium]